MIKMDNASKMTLFINANEAFDKSVGKFGIKESNREAFVFGYTAGTMETAKAFSNGEAKVTKIEKIKEEV